MALVLTGAALYVIRYTDEAGAERNVTVKKGRSVDTLGLPDSVIEELRAAEYAPRRKYFTEDTEEKQPKKATVRIKASKNEAAVPPTTISMVGMRKELAADRAERRELKKERIVETKRKDDGIVRAWSEPSFDNTYEVDKRQEQEKADEPVEAPETGVQAVVEMDAEVVKADQPEAEVSTDAEEKPKKAPIKRTPTKKKTGTKKKTAGAKKSTPKKKS